MPEKNAFIPSDFFEDESDNPAPPGEVAVSEGEMGRSTRTVSAEGTDMGGEMPLVGDEEDRE